MSVASVSHCAGSVAVERATSGDPNPPPTGVWVHVPPTGALVPEFSLLIDAGQAGELAAGPPLTRTPPPPPRWRLPMAGAEVDPAPQTATAGQVPETTGQALDRLRGQWRTRRAAQQPTDDVEALGRAVRTLLDGDL